MSGPIPPATRRGDGLAIIAGAGSLPFAVADAGLKQGRHVVLFAMRGWADVGRVAAYSHHWLHIGQLGSFVHLAAKEGCSDIVIVGSVTRPSWWQLRPDFLTLWHMPELVRLFRGGDDHLQSGLANIIERHGFRLLALQEIAPKLMMPAGPIGSRVPTERDLADMRRGLALLAANSPFDIGQAVVVGNNQVLAVEGPEGTDRMVERVAELRRIGRIRVPTGVGVLVKAPKLGQDLRIDLPTIGPETVKSAASARLAGIAVRAGATVVAELSQLAMAADRANIFIVGVPADASGA